MDFLIGTYTPTRINSLYMRINTYRPRSTILTATEDAQIMKKIGLLSLSVMLASVTMSQAQNERIRDVRGPHAERPDHGPRPDRARPGSNKESRADRGPGTPPTRAQAPHARGQRGPGNGPPHFAPRMKPQGPHTFNQRSQRAPRDMRFGQRHMQSGKGLPKFDQQSPRFDSRSPFDRRGPQMNRHHRKPQLNQRGLRGQQRGGMRPPLRIQGKPGFHHPASEQNRAKPPHAKKKKGAKEFGGNAKKDQRKGHERAKGKNKKKDKKQKRR